VPAYKLRTTTLDIGSVPYSKIAAMYLILSHTNRHQASAKPLRGSASERKRQIRSNHSLYRECHKHVQNDYIWR